MRVSSTVRYRRLNVLALAVVVAFIFGAVLPPPPHVALARKIDAVVYERYNLKPPPGRWGRFMRRLFRRPDYEAPDEWKTKAERKHGQLALKERIAHMEALDRMDEQLYRDHLLSRTALLIISPTLAMTTLSQVASTATVAGGHSIFYPTVFAGDTYNIAFSIGKQYPFARRYLSVFLATCQRREKADKRALRFIRTFHVGADGLVSDVEIDTGRSFARWRSPEAPDDVQVASNGASYFRWEVPARRLFPGTRYCLLFDMARENPAIYMDKHAEKAGPVYNLKRDFTPRLSIHTTRHFHRTLTSPWFEVLHQPPIYGEDWFARLYGGKDLMVFMGGRLFSFRFFSVVYAKEEAGWNQALFHQDVSARARVVGEWLADMLQSKRSGRRVDGGPGSRFDTGYAAVEDRREARSRAIGLLFHPHGRATLRQIGESFLRIANSFDTSIQSYGRYSDFFVSSLAGGMKRIFEEYFGGFASSRRKLATWVGRLRRLLGGMPPDESLLETYAQIFGGKRRMYIPELKENAYSPEYIHQKILKYMSTMVRHEINLIVWEVGNAVLRRRTSTDRWVEAFMGASTYNYGRAESAESKYVDFASTLKVIGTKFVIMADGFALESVSNDDGSSSDDSDG